MKKHLLQLALVLVAASFLACTHPGHKSGCDGTSCALKKGKKVWFISPSDGATVSKRFRLQFGSKGMDVKPAGKLVEGTGHHHLLINAKDVSAGKVVPSDKKHLHFGKGQTEAMLELPAGKHELTLQFADGAHASYGENMRAKITVNVK